MFGVALVLKFDGQENQHPSTLAGICFFFQRRTQSRKILRPISAEQRPESFFFSIVVSSSSSSSIARRWRKVIAAFWYASPFSLFSSNARLHILTSAKSPANPFDAKMSPVLF
jgi:hypothetical protein